MPPKTEDMKTFDQRIHRFDPDFKPTKAHRVKKILGFRARMPWMMIASVAILFYATMTVTKVVMENELGTDGFDAKVATLSDGGDASKIAAKLLWRDPVMAFVQDKVL